MTDVNTLARRLAETLDTTHRSLATYGPHPLIDSMFTKIIQEYGKYQERVDITEKQQKRVGRLIYMTGIKANIMEFLLTYAVDQAQFLLLINDLINRNNLLTSGEQNEITNLYNEYKSLTLP